VLGCGGHLAALHRIRAGSFGIGVAVPLETVQSEGRAAEHRLIPLEGLLPDTPAAVLTARGAERAAHGGMLGPADLAAPAERTPWADGRRLRLLDPAGRLVGIGEARAGGLLHPVIVLV
jgi:tRNA U55 pseudouridine synthase TruB